MSERHRHSLNFFERGRRVGRAVRNNGVKGLVSVVVGIGICPADDIAAIGATVVTATNESNVHQGVIPADTYKLRIPDASKKGIKPHRKLKR